MRILVVSHYFESHRGGVERIAVELCSHLSQEGCEVTWAASACPDANSEGAVRRVHMRGWNMIESRLGFPYPIWSIPSLKKLFREVKNADLVHLHDCLYMGNIFAYMFARCLRKPVIITQHVGLVPYSNPILRWTMSVANWTVSRTLLRGCDCCVFYSRVVEQYFSRFVRFRRKVFISNGVDREVFHSVTAAERLQLRNQHGISAADFVILFVGRFVEKKGLPVLRQIAQKTPQCKWVFVGWGPHDPSLWNLENVESKGALDQNRISSWYQAADLLVLPSKGEGFPLVIQEAMSCGLPVLTSTDTAKAIPRIEEVVLTCDPSEQELSSRLTQIIDGRETLTDCRPKLVSYAQEHWDWSKCGKQYQDLVTELLETSERLKSGSERTQARE